MSFEEFEKQFTTKIDVLENIVKNKSDQRKIIENDIERMTNQLAYLSMERATKAKDLDLLEQKYWKAKNEFDAKNSEIEDLKIQLK